MLLRWCVCSCSWRLLLRFFGFQIIFARTFSTHRLLGPCCYPDVHLSFWVPWDIWAVSRHIRTLLRDYYSVFMTIKRLVDIYEACAKMLILYQLVNFPYSIMHTNFELSVVFLERDNSSCWSGGSAAAVVVHASYNRISLTKANLGSRGCICLDNNIGSKIQLLQSLDCSAIQTVRTFGLWTSTQEMDTQKALTAKQSMLLVWSTLHPFIHHFSMQLSNAHKP